MVQSLLVGQPAEKARAVREELIDRLKNASRYEQAADLIMQHRDTLNDPKAIEHALDCLLKAGRYLRAYHLCLEHAPAGDTILLNTVKTHVKIAYDLKRNHFVSILAEFEKRVMRLRIV